MDDYPLPDAYELMEFWREQERAASGATEPAVTDQELRQQGLNLQVASWDVLPANIQKLLMEYKDKPIDA